MNFKVSELEREPIDFDLELAPGEAAFSRAMNGSMDIVIRRIADAISIPAKAVFTLNGKPVRVKRKLYVALNKPPGLVCSRQDEFERPTIYGLLPKEWGHLHSVGRLDYHSEGLIFLTNDGEFSLHLTHPRYGVRKKYVATVEGQVAAEMLGQFTQGVWYQGEQLKAEKARLVSASRAQSVVELELAQGKNREVRRLFESQRISVKRLQRVQIGKIKLGELPVGKWRALTEPEIKSLMT